MPRTKEKKTYPRIAFRVDEALAGALAARVKEKNLPSPSAYLRALVENDLRGEPADDRIARLENVMSANHVQLAAILRSMAITQRATYGLLDVAKSDPCLHPRRRRARDAEGRSSARRTALQRRSQGRAKSRSRNARHAREGIRAPQRGVRQRCSEMIGCSSIGPWRRNGINAEATPRSSHYPRKSLPFVQPADAAGQQNKHRSINTSRTSLDWSGRYGPPPAHNGLARSGDRALLRTPSDAQFASAIQPTTSAGTLQRTPGIWCGIAPQAVPCPMETSLQRA